MKNKFNVIIGDNGKFKEYDVLPYLEDRWDYFPKSPEETLEAWVQDSLMYQYWSRTEYEIILQSWPPDKNEGAKVDIYWQCMLNLDTIVRLFKENVSNREKS